MSIGTTDILQRLFQVFLKRGEKSNYDLTNLIKNLTRDIKILRQSISYLQIVQILQIE